MICFLSSLIEGTSSFYTKARGVKPRFAYFCGLNYLPVVKKVLFVFGTRPEAIKMAPLVRTFEQSSDFETRVCVTAQHREMLDQVLDFFGIKPDYDLDLMKHNQSLLQVTAGAISGLEGVINDFQPDLIFVQGDTTTAFVGALAGYYSKVKVAHIEAGLRSGNLKANKIIKRKNRSL